MYYPLIALFPLATSHAALPDLRSVDQMVLDLTLQQSSLVTPWMCLQERTNVVPKSRVLQLPTLSGQEQPLGKTVDHLPAEYYRTTSCRIGTLDIEEDLLQMART